MFTVSSAVPGLLRGIRSHLFIFVSFFTILRGGSKKELASAYVCCFPQEFHYIYILLFRSLIYLEFIFVYAVRQYSNFILMTILKKPAFTLFFRVAATNSRFH